MNFECLQASTVNVYCQLEETALSYLVKRWNELEISVGGQTVSASLASKGVKRDGNTRRKKAKKMKTN